MNAEKYVFGEIVKDGVIVSGNRINPAYVEELEAREKKLTRLVRGAYLDKLSAAANEDEIPDTDLLPFMVEGKLEAFAKEMAKYVRDCWSHASETDGSEYCAFCNGSYLGDNKFEHDSTCPVPRAEEYLKGMKT